MRVRPPRKTPIDPTHAIAMITLPLRFSSPRGASLSMSNSVLEPGPVQALRRSRRPLVHMTLVLGTAGVIAGSGWLRSAPVSEVQRSEAKGQQSERKPAGGNPSELLAIAAPADGQPAADQAQSDEQHRAAVQGTWYVDDYYGRCILDIHEGGKGTMTVVFGSYYAYLLAARVDAVLEWTVKDGRALFKTISGKPEAAYAVIAREKGEDRDRKIVAIGEKQMVLKDDQDDDSIATWTRARSLADAVKVE